MTRHVWEYVESSADKFGSKHAFADGTETCTYSAFRERCEKLSARLLRHHRRPSEPGREPVVIFLDKSIQALTAIFSCAATGNFYSPIDIQIPEQRLKRIMETLQPKVVVTHSLWRELMLKYVSADCIECVDEESFLPSCVGELEKISEQIIDTDLLYVIFTSGSTGIPKGVSVSHRAVIDYAEWASHTFQLNESVRQGNLGPFSFDLSVHDIFCTVRNGSFLYLIPEKTITFPKQVVDILNRERIDSIFWVPSALAHIANSKILSRVSPQHLKRIMFCGEVMSGKHLAIWQNAVPEALCVNLYGPTEATEACTFYVVKRMFSAEETVPVGRACSNTSILLITENGEQVAESEVGVVGEIFIRGSCLSSGYYNDPERTRQAFVQNPLHNRYVDLVYRTGDLAKFNEQGELVFVGRNDSQIKRLGYRIELGEIDAVALSHPSVERACTIFVRESGEIVLCVEGRDIEIPSLEKVLHEALPRYMWPNRVQLLGEIPLNPNGKYDCSKLVQILISQN